MKPSKVFSVNIETVNKKTNVPLHESKQQPTESGEQKSIVTQVKLIEKLPSIGPLQINDLDEFLEKSRIDFECLYRDKAVSKLEISDFNIVKKLGSGSFGRVILAELKEDQTLYAIKVIDKKVVMQKRYVRYVSNEKRILQSINFPFVVYLKYFFVDFNFLYLVMPFVPGGDFYDYLRKYRPLNESDARFYVGQLVLALEYLHYLELIHRDVKPENIIIDAFGYLKLADFGQCIKCYSNDRTWTITGTPEYMAPEIIAGNGYNCAVDWWALGVMTYEMCAGHRPFKHEDVKKLYKLIQAVKYTFPKQFTHNLKSFINRLLVDEPSKRIVQDDRPAVVIKSHSWFKEMNWLSLLNRSIQAPYLPDSEKVFKGIKPMS